MTGMYSMVERRNLQGSHELLIENLSCIASAYGEAAAEEILVELSLRVERIFGLSAHYVAMTPDGVRFFSCTERDVMAVLSATTMPVQAGGTHVVMALRQLSIAPIWRLLRGFMKRCSATASIS